MEKARYPWAIAPVEEFNANETLSDSGGRIISGDGHGIVRTKQGGFWHAKSR
jgi:hypothetical protein